VELADLDDAELGQVDARLTADVRAVLTVRGALEARAAVGGTAPSRVAEQLAQLQQTVSEQVTWAAAAPSA
jgi:argininosuccinate lyase